MIRALAAISWTLRTGRVHPTVVMNALVEAENSGGPEAIHELERSLTRLCLGMGERDDPARPLARAWLDATRAYAETFCQVVPVGRGRTVGA